MSIWYSLNIGLNFQDMPTGKIEIYTPNLIAPSERRVGPATLAAVMSTLFLDQQGNLSPQGKWLMDNPLSQGELTTTTPADIDRWVRTMPKVLPGLSEEALQVIDSFRNPNTLIEDQFLLHPQLQALDRAAYKETGQFITFRVKAGSHPISICENDTDQLLLQDVIVTKAGERKPTADRIGAWQVSPPIPFFARQWPDGYRNSIVKLWKEFTDAVQAWMQPIRICVGTPTDNYSLRPLNNQSTFDFSLEQWRKALAGLKPGDQLENFRNHPFTDIYHDPNKNRDSGWGYQGIKVIVTEPNLHDALYMPRESRTSMPFTQLMKLTGEQVFAAILKVFESREKTIFPVITAANDASKIFNESATRQFREEINSSPRPQFLAKLLERFIQTSFTFWPGELDVIKDHLLNEGQPTNAIQVAEV